MLTTSVHLDVNDKIIFGKGGKLNYIGNIGELHS